MSAIHSSTSASAGAAAMRVALALLSAARYGQSTREQMTPSPARISYPPLSPASAIQSPRVQRVSLMVFPADQAHRFSDLLAISAPSFPIVPSLLGVGDGRHISTANKSAQEATANKNQPG